MCAFAFGEDRSLKFGPWYYGWTVVAVCMLFQAIIFGITVYSFTLYVSAWVADPALEVSRARALLGNSLLMVVTGVISPIIGTMMDRYSIRMLICFGAVAASAGMALVAIASAFWQILLIYGALLSFCILLSGPLAAQTLVSKWFDGRRGTAMGIVTTGTSIGGFIVPIMVAYLFTEVGWRTTHLIIAMAILVLILPPVLLFIRNNPGQLGIDPDPPAPGTQDNRADTTPLTPRHWSTSNILSEPNFWVICGVAALIGAGFISIANNLSPFLTDLGIDTIQQGTLIAVYAGIMIPAKIVFGMLSERVDIRLLLWGAMLCLGASASLLLIAKTFAMLALACALLGAASGSILPLLGVLISTRFGTHAFGRVMGMLGPINALSSFAPVGIGWVRDATGSYDRGWIALLILLLPAVVITWFLDRIGRSRRNLATPSN